jgi:hypothetical protein
MFLFVKQIFCFSCTSKFFFYTGKSCVSASCDVCLANLVKRFVALGMHTG